MFFKSYNKVVDLKEFTVKILMTSELIIKLDPNETERSFSHL